VIFSRKGKPPAGGLLEPCDAFAKLNDREWLQVLVDSLSQHEIRGVRLPRFPADDLQRQFVGSAGEHTLHEAFNFYQVVKRYCAEQGCPLRPNSSVLDFGCGFGRMVRFFLKDVRAANVHGFDVDPTVIALCQQLFQHGRFEVCNSRPPAPMPDDSFDVVYAYSVFSHLSEEIHLEWVREFARLLKPGGLLLATTQGRTFVDFCASLRAKSVHDSAWHESLAKSFTDRDQALRDYDAGHFLHVATGGGDFRPSSFYGETLIPRGYVERAWTPYLELVDFRDDRSFLPQALIVMRKAHA
jgi:SAM-dependent methyltransferase